MLLYKGTIPTWFNELVDELVIEELTANELLLEKIAEEITLLFEELTDELTDEIANEELRDDELTREEELATELIEELGDVLTDELIAKLLLLELLTPTTTVDVVDEATKLWLDGNTMADVIEDAVLDNEAIELRTELELETTTTTAELLTEDDANELLTDDEDMGAVGVEPPPPQAVSTKAKLQVAQVLVIKRIYRYSPCKISNC